VLQGRGSVKKCGRECRWMWGSVRWCGCVQEEAGKCEECCEVRERTGVITGRLCRLQEGSGGWIELNSYISIFIKYKFHAILGNLYKLDVLQCD